MIPKQRKQEDESGDAGNAFTDFAVSAFTKLDPEWITEDAM